MRKAALHEAWVNLVSLRESSRMDMIGHLACAAQTTTQMSQVLPTMPSALTHH